MRNSVLPIMGVMTVIAAAVGLQLGESAVAQIDPLHFMGPAERPRDVTANGPPLPALGYADASGWEEGYAARAEDCGDCASLNARETHATFYDPPAITEEPDGQRWEYASADDADRADDARAERTVEARHMERYLHYPVSADRAEPVRAPREELSPEPQSDEPVGL